MHHFTNGRSGHRSLRTDRGHIIHPQQGWPSAPLTPPTATILGSHPSMQSTPRSSKPKYSLGWLQKFGRHDPHDHSRTSLSSATSGNTGWGTANDVKDGGDDFYYSHDMASQYFQATSGFEKQGTREVAGQPSVAQRVMHRMASAYPLPCDDQEQQVSVQSKLKSSPN